jgi:alpha-mannosidase
MTDQAQQRLASQIFPKIAHRMDRLHRRLRPQRRVVVDVTMAECSEHLTPAQAARMKFRPAPAGTAWGKQPWGSAWFRLRIAIPREFAGSRVDLCWSPGEAIIWREGEPVHELDSNHGEYVLTRRAKGGERIELLVEAVSPYVTGNSFWGSPEGTTTTFPGGTLTSPEITTFDPQLWQLCQDLSFLRDLAAALPEDDTRRGLILRGIDLALAELDLRTDESISSPQSIARARGVLAPLLASPANASAQRFTAVGHSHIDCAWLWPMAETRRKCGRTFSTMLALMEEYPEFVFCQSQPLLYEFVRERYPTLWRRIARRVREGRWIPVGGMWVEPDCQITGGESLVRQLIHGIGYFEENFGVTPRECWLPDVFGYSASMPQILKLAGIERFLTQKISWNTINEFPYHSFHWQGIDGSKVLTHFSPSNTYCSEVQPKQIIEAEGRHREKDRVADQLLLFGFGDGGGGVTRDMLERVRRSHDCEGLPKVAPGTPDNFFAALEARRDVLPSWSGELYLELHRGTLTTQAETKRLNRRAEGALRDAEVLSCLAWGTHAGRKTGDLHKAWRLVLNNQFHDILPGSSITLVHTQAEAELQRAIATAEHVRDQALEAYAADIDTRGEGQAVLLVNTLSWERTSVAELELPSLRGRSSATALAPDGTRLPVMRGHDGRYRMRATVPAMGHAVYHILPQAWAAKEAVPDTLDNGLVRVRLDRQGRVISIRDLRHGREVLKDGERISLTLLEDIPNSWDAWDVEHFARDKVLERDGELLSSEIIESNAIRTVLRQTRRLSQSHIELDIILEAGSPQVTFDARIAWGEERNVLLKADVPMAVHTDEARCEIQFGHVRRPTHRNTTWDQARFEVCAHRWVDLSETGYGVALLNNGRYGHDMLGSRVGLSLLRAPKTPDPRADIGRTHAITWAVLPHAGDHTTGVVRAGYELNTPLLVRAVASHAGTRPSAQSLLSVDSPHAVIEAVKPAERGDGIVVRLYEAHGATAPTRLTTALPVRRAEAVDLRERSINQLRLQGGSIAVDLTPFQIRTVALK